MMDKVSIIIPCYNDGEYIEQTLESISSQTYTNLEVIVVDDGSTHNITKKVLNKISNRDGLVVYRISNGGPSKARNYGIEKATGKYILPLDADDIIEPTYIEKAIKIIEQDLDIGVVYCKADLFGEKDGPWDLPDYSLQSMLLDNVVFVTAIFYRSDWKRVGGFSETMKHGMEDYDFWLSILSLGKKVYQIQEVLFHYRIKTISRTTKFMNEKENVKIAYEEIFHKHEAFYRDNFEEYCKVLRSTIIDQIYTINQYETIFKRFEIVSKILKIINKIPVIRTLAEWFLYR